MEGRFTEYPAPALNQTDQVVCQTVSPPEGVAFQVVTGNEANDPISRELAAGVFPPDYEWPLRLLRTIVPKCGRLLDLGGHVGTFALAAAAMGHRVVVVEASPRNAMLLAESIRRNGFEDRMTLIHAGISDRPGTLEFSVDGPYGHVATGPTGHPITRVPAVRGDDLLARIGWDTVDYIKLDVEGSEVAALRGLAKLLARPDAPPIFVESNSHTLNLFKLAPRDLKNALAAAGYRLHRAAPGSLVPVLTAEIQPEICVDYLAFKQTPATIRDWRLDPPQSGKTRVAAVARMLRHPEPVYRAHAARTLLQAATGIVRFK